MLGGKAAHTSLDGLSSYSPQEGLVINFDYASSIHACLCHAPVVSTLGLIRGASGLLCSAVPGVCQKGLQCAALIQAHTGERRVRTVELIGIQERDCRDAIRILFNLNGTVGIADDGAVDGIVAKGLTDWACLGRQAGHFTMTLGGTCCGAKQLSGGWPDARGARGLELQQKQKLKAAQGSGVLGIGIRQLRPRPRAHANAHKQRTYRRDVHGLSNLMLTANVQ